MTLDQLVRIFEKIELNLIASLSRNLKAHKEWEKQEGFTWPAWQAEKIKNMEALRKESTAIMDKYKPMIDRETEKLLRDQYEEGMDDVKAKTAEYRRGIPPIADNNFFGINRPKIDELIAETMGKERTAETAALRMTEDVYRNTMLQAETAQATGSMTFQAAIKQAVEDFSRKGINSIEFKNGRRVNIVDYVQMALRTASTRATLQGGARQRATLGIDTVLVSRYGGCSDTCLPWQGRVYIDDVFGDWRGETDGERGKSSNGKWYPLLSVAVRAGLFHPNCRHVLSTWIEGISKLPPELNAEMIRKVSKLEQKQRRMEKAVREWKRRKEGELDPSIKAAYGKKVREAQGKLREFVGEHEDVLKRDPWREKTYGVIDLENHPKGAILRGVNIEDIPVTNAGIQRVPLVKSRWLDDAQNKELRKAHRELLRKVQQMPEGTEAAAVYTMDVKKISEHRGEEGRVRVPPVKSPHILIHNHPSGNTFSHNDLARMLGNPDMRVLTAVGNNGAVHMLEKQEDYNVAGYIKMMKEEVEANPEYMATPESYVGFMERILERGEEFGIKYISRG